MITVLTVLVVMVLLLLMTRVFLLMLMMMTIMVMRKCAKRYQEMTVVITSICSALSVVTNKKNIQGDFYILPHRRHSSRVKFDVDSSIPSGSGISPRKQQISAIGARPDNFACCLLAKLFNFVILTALLIHVLHFLHICHGPYCTDIHTAVLTCRH